jgi:uncharacterized protein YdaU (DUF1376 family)
MVEDTMHFYKFNIADYRKDTSGLQPEEHYIYRTLLDECYLTELPLNPDIRELMRDLRLTSDQKDALEYVLNKYFELTDKGYINNRVNVVLSSIYAKSESARQSAKIRWDKYERNANAMRTHSERNANGMLPTNPLTHNPLTQEKDIPPAGAGSSKPKVSTCPYQKIVDLYHEKLPMLPKVVRITDKRKSHIRARWNGDADNMKFWSDYFDAVSRSKFLTGQAQPTQGRPVFRADIDFLIREDVMIKTQEGKYHA